MFKLCFNTLFFHTFFVYQPIFFVKFNFENEIEKSKYFEFLIQLNTMRYMSVIFFHKLLNTGNMNFCIFSKSYLYLENKNLYYENPIYTQKKLRYYEIRIFQINAMVCMFSHNCLLYKFEVLKSNYFSKNNCKFIRMKFLFIDHFY